MRVVGIDEVVLPGDALDLWDRGDLSDLLCLPHDGTKVEIVGGAIVVTPALHLRHHAIAVQIVKAVVLAGGREPSWEVVQHTGVLLRAVAGAYIPDLVLMRSSTFEAAGAANVRWLAPNEIEMAIEITSAGNAGRDRKATGETATKWNGYARTEVPYYLLVDRDPEIARATLYSMPDPSLGVYLREESWAFGETIRLPEPFGLEIVTDRWRPWD